MKKKILIEGMQCGHCTAHVKEALEGLGVSSVEVSLEGKYALVDSDKSNEELKSVIEEEGYEVTKIEE